MAELLGLFAASFAAATLIPMPSEAALFAYLKFHPESAPLAVGVATIGNTAGGMTTYLLGRLLPSRNLDEKTIRALKTWGAPITFFAWVPIVGDGLCAAAGWLRIRWWAALAFMAAGRLARYVAVAFLAT